MKIFNSLLFSFTLLYSSSIFAETALNLIPTPPPITARAYMLQDFHSSEVIMAKNVDEPLDPASLTKLMTAYLVFQRLQSGKIKLTDTALVSEKAWRMTGSRMYLEVDSRVSIQLLLQGMIIQSGNDASVALAEFIAGTEEAFVNLMNEQAQRLGLSHTHYTNSTGLPDEQHYSTVRDLMRMAQILIHDFPEYYRWYSEREFTYNNITQANRNLLLRRDSPVDGIKIDGMKTGYTETAGYCLAASARLGKMRLISIVMGAKSNALRLRESEQMLDYGFRFFETYRLYQAYQPLDMERVWQGSTAQLQLGLEKPLYVTIPIGQSGQLSTTGYIDKYIMAPVIAGETYGTLKINLGDKVISERPLIALSAIDSGNLWNRLIDSVFLFFY